jgi:carbohydrate-selective porin OprB
VYHEDEYVFESTYTLQLTPTTRIQPDLQVVWNAAYNPSSAPAVVAQLQLILSW